MKILITGTHFTPAQALIEQLNKLGKYDILYLGRRSTLEGDNSESIESKILPKLGVRFISLISGRFARNFSLWTLISLFKLPVGFIQSFWMILKEQPDVVVSFGGYLAFPVVFWSWWFSIPIIIHEQTLGLGLANWLSFPFASKVVLSYPNKEYQKYRKVDVTGNPIRQDMLIPAKPSSNVAQFLKSVSLPLILVLGGNQGSHFINRLIGNNLNELTKKYTIVHQTGDSKFQDYDYLSEEAKKIHEGRYLPAKWLDSNDLSAIVEKSDLVISRAGMNTLYELALRSKPVFVIPIPTSVTKEQSQNARFFANHKLGEFMSQSEITNQAFIRQIDEMMESSADYKGNAESKAVFVSDGAQKLAQLVLGLERRDV